MKKWSGNWITIWLILVCVLWLVTGTYAAYYSVWSNKGVLVAKSSNSDIRFSSNYLPLCEKITTEVPYKIVTIPSQSDVSVGITVCNYPQEDISKVHESAIPYQLTAQILDMNGESFASVTYQANGETVTKTLAEVASMLNLGTSSFDADGTLVVSDVLKSEDGTPDLRVHTLTCAKENIAVFNAVTVQLRAEPAFTEETVDADNCGLNSKQLLARLRFVAVENQDTRWHDRFLETGDTKEIDAFNYEIYGTAQQTLVLSWNRDFVELSKWSREELPIVSSDDLVPSITLKVGGAGMPTSYRMQFYRTCAIPKDETWDAVKEYITITK